MCLRVFACVHARFCFLGGSIDFLYSKPKPLFFERILHNSSSLFSIPFCTLIFPLSFSLILHLLHHAMSVSSFLPPLLSQYAIISHYFISFVANASASSPEGYPIFTSKHRSFVSKNLSPLLYAQLCTRQTSSGFTLDQLIQVSLLFLFFSYTQYSLN